MIRNNPPSEFFGRDNRKQILEVRTAIRNLKNAYKNWDKNQYLKLKVEFLEKAVLLYENDQLCHKADELFKEYEPLFAQVGIPNLVEDVVEA